MDSSEKRPMEDEQIDEEEVWRAIRYLDPDEPAKKHVLKTVTIIASWAVLLVFGGAWFLLWLRVSQPCGAATLTAPPREHSFTRPKRSSYQRYTRCYCRESLKRLLC